MPTITKITVQKKRTDRYNIFLDNGKGEEYGFSVDEDVLIKHGLKKGMVLDDLLFSEISFSDDIRKAYNTAVNYLARMMRTETEVRKHLAEKEVDEVIIQEVIHKLNEYQFLNDEQLAFAYVRTQMNTTDKGPSLIKRELKEKGIPEEYITEAIEEFPFELQVEKAIALCEKYMKKNKQESQKIMKQKMEQLHFRKGFSSQVFQIAFEQMETTSDDEELESLRYQAEKLERKYSKFTGYEYQQKMKQALYRKGFSIEAINRYLESK
ncbi:recombination regulator RecX [Robertmurraya korlensis]|jgi:regulatory protein|uniref:recombination regulator RecX n=1 Tax=Robertmurraya korlensis TaxID=519977 RepID=UPI0008246403|nr:recombination regulator RecX [Robertmurraya korlensis]